MTLRLGDLFSGIGGFSLAARWMGWETAWFSEIDPYASAVLAKHWPGVPNHGDITKIDFTQVEPVDLLCGGFPCQDLSVAGKRKGLSGERSGLWSEYARAVRALQPRWVVVENVPPLLTGGFDVVRGDLRAAGYKVARPVLMSATAVGAPHLRERLWIVAHADGQRCGEARRLRPDSVALLGRSGEALDDTNGGRFGRNDRRHNDEGGRSLPAEGRQAVGNADKSRREGTRGPQPTDCSRPGGGTAFEPWPTGSWLRGRDGSVRLVPAPESGICPVAAGIPARMVRLRGAGNAIVPQEAFQIFQAIDAREVALRGAA